MKKTAEGHLLKDDASNYDKNAYEKPSVTVDIGICSIMEGDLKIILIKRKYPPFKNCWALPGGFVKIEDRENLDQTAKRELMEETRIKDIYIEQLKTYGDPDRDPRMRVITVAYYALMPVASLPIIIEAGDDAKELDWFSIMNPPRLAFDHSTILNDLLERIKGKLWWSPIAFSLVPKVFTWKELQNVFESVLEEEQYPLNFRRKIKDRFVIEELDTIEQVGTGPIGRPATFLRYKGMKQ